MKQSNVRHLLMRHLLTHLLRYPVPAFSDRKLLCRSFLDQVLFVRFRFFLFAILASLSLFFWASFYARAAEPEPSTYLVGVEDIAYYPHYISDANGYGGFARELLDLFAAAGGIRFEFVPYPVQRLFTEFLSGAVDFKYPDNPRWQVGLKKDLDVHYSDVVVDYIAGAVVRPENLGAGIGHLKVLGYVKGFTPLPFMESIKAGKIVPSENLNFSGVLHQTLSGRVDAAYVNLNVAADQLRCMGKEPGALVFDPGLPHSRSSFFLSSIKYPDRIEQFNTFLKERAEDIARLKEKYNIRLYP